MSIEPEFGVRLSIFVFIAFLLLVLVAILYMRMKEADDQAGIE